MAEDLRELIEQVIGGSERSWQRLFIRFGPNVESIARRSRAMGSLRHQPDDCRNVMTRVFERLRRDDFRALRLYREWQSRNDNRYFDDWLTVVTTNVARDYVEERLGSARDQPTKRLANTLAGVLEDDDEALAVGAHITPKLLAQQIMQFAREDLPEDQLAVLQAWLIGNDFEAIAKAAGLADAAEARRVLRAALGRLRRRLAESTESA